jgi:hypothetical protein
MCLLICFEGFYMDLPPAVIIHSLGDAKLALSYRRPVTLLSAPAAALYGGCSWWYQLIAASETEYPSLLDCADAPGRAVESLKMGLKGIVLGCEPPLFAAVTELAALYGALVLAQAPPAVNLADHGAERKLAAWLGG